MNFALRPTPPFDFNLTAEIFSNGDEQILRYEAGRYWQVLRLDGKLVVIIVESLGTVDDPRLSVEIKPDDAISSKDIKVVEEKVATMFNLRLDLGPFYKEVKGDPVLSEIVEKLQGLRSPVTSTVFEALISSIIEQQISLNVALSLERRLTKTFGETVETGGKTYYAFPAPNSLASATIEQIRGCGLSQKKSEYIAEISKLVGDGKLDLESLKNHEDLGEITFELDKIRGIGIWTAELTMMRGMNKLEAMPADDLGLRRCIAHYYRNDKKISGKEARAIADKWGRWKGLAGFYLIVAERKGLKI